MSRYIDADKLYIAAMDTNFYDAADEDVVLDLINQQPTADVQEVKHGESIKHKSKLEECSECGCTFVVVSDMDNCYCTHCGAKIYKDKQQ